jgi:hypothetical protein
MRVDIQRLGREEIPPYRAAEYQPSSTFINPYQQIDYQPLTVKSLFPENFFQKKSLQQAASERGKHVTPLSLQTHNRSPDDNNHDRNIHLHPVSCCHLCCTKNRGSPNSKRLIILFTHHEKTALPEAFPAGLFFLESEKVRR